MCNVDVRTTAKKSGVFLYELAERLGISEPTMTRLLRKELSDSKKQELLSKETLIKCTRKAKNMV